MKRSRSIYAAITSFFVVLVICILFQFLWVSQGSETSSGISKFTSLLHRATLFNYSYYQGQYNQSNLPVARLVSKSLYFSKLTNENAHDKKPAPVSFLSMCHLKSKFDERIFSKVLIVGASSFIGASIAKLIANYNYTTQLVVTEDAVNIDFDPLAWYRWEKLIAMGLSPQYINFSDHSTASGFIRKHSPQVVIYVPTALMSAAEGLDFGKTVRQVTEAYENYLVLLHSVPSSTAFILISDSEPITRYNSMIRLFELSLSVYHYLYQINVVIIRTRGIYGPWQRETQSARLCFIGDLVKYILYNIISNFGSSCKEYYNPGCDGLNKQGISLTKQWMNNYKLYREHQKKNVIASTYMTVLKNPQYNKAFINNNYYFMEYWFRSIYNLNLHMLVFHDNLSDAFSSTFSRKCDKCEFVRMKLNEDYSPNDQRFLHFYNYILAHPEIGHFVSTDMRDVVIQNNPFEVMNAIGDMLYVGKDKPFHKTLKTTYLPSLYRKCFPSKLDYHEDFEQFGFFNAGVIGGSRHVMLAFLTRFLQYLQITSFSKRNCNMAIMEHITHKFFFESTFSGWPFNAGFLTEQVNIPGLAILHKWNKPMYSPPS